MMSRTTALRYTFVTTLLVGAAIANAQPTTPPTTDETTAAEVERAPLPGDESGRVDADPGDSRTRKVLRGALFLPRTAVAIAFAPIEGGVWAVERFQLVDRAERLFFNDAMTMGLYPTFALESGFGLNVGARFVHRDLFGKQEHFDLRASTGGRFHEKAATSFKTGDRFGKATSLEVTGEYERRAKDSFYGIGNADDETTDGLIDPLAGDMAARARYRHRTARVSALFDRKIAGDFHVRAAGQVADHEISDGDGGAGITEVFEMDRLAGYDKVRNAYGELELRFDSRDRASEWEPRSTVATGWLLAGFAGRVTALDDGADFWRYGMDLQKFTTLGEGPRVLILRTHGEAVTGETTDVPFIELPRIGGGNTLRGYAVDRFRDRVAVTGSAEYQWDLSRFVSASLFVDAGKVAPSLRDLDVHDLRVGYGASVELHSARSFLARATVASSIEGGLFFNIGLDPVFELEGRTERR